MWFQAAFLLPVITRMLNEGVQGASQAEQQSPQVLIISPTRELTMQIYGEARKFVNGSIYRPTVIYGGTSVGHQLRQVESGTNILVSMPGRLIDFLNRKKVMVCVNVGMATVTFFAVLAYCIILVPPPGIFPAEYQHNL